jgi:hypothetical protein
MLPRNVVDKVFSLLSGKVEFSIDDNAEFIKITDSKGLVVTSNLTPGEYPILGKIIEQNEYQKKYIINREEFIDAIKTVKPFTDSMKALNFFKYSMTEKKNILGVSAINSDKTIEKSYNLAFIQEDYKHNINQNNNLDIVMPISIGSEKTPEGVNELF